MSMLYLLVNNVVFVAERTEITAGFVFILHKFYIFVLVKDKGAEAFFRFLVIFIVPAVFTKAVHILFLSRIF